MLDLEKLEQIKRIAIIALFSDDDLMDSLVLKGGNALDMIYGIAQRSSLDLDFSIDKEFDKSEISLIQDKIQKVLKETFEAKGYEAFDIHFFEVPDHINSTAPDFWGGYCLGTQFKWKIFLRFCVRFLTINDSILNCCEKPWRNGAGGFRAVSVGSAAGREWAPPHARRSLAAAGRAGQPGSI
ncbi:hypothetical protein ES703_31502 [subsurface metagenome]